MSHLITGSLRLIALFLFFHRPFIHSQHHSLPHLLARTRATFILNFLHVPSSSLLFSSLNHRVTQSSSNLPPHLPPCFFFFHYMLTCRACSLIPFLPPPIFLPPSPSVLLSLASFIHPCHFVFCCLLYSSASHTFASSLLHSSSYPAVILPSHSL